MDGLRDSALAWWAACAAPALAAALPTLVQAVVVAAATAFLARYAADSFRRAAGRSSAVDPSTLLLGTRLIRIAILALGATLFLDVVGLPLGTLIATIGITGLAISLALQDLLRNFFAGIYLLFERPFQLGDRIRVKEFEGTVEHVQILIPNSMVVAEVVSNRTGATPTTETEPPI
jgi:small conductance mechanosensitive channel